MFDSSLLLSTCHCLLCTPPSSLCPWCTYALSCSTCYCCKWATAILCSHWRGHQMLIPLLGPMLPRLGKIWTVPMSNDTTLIWTRSAIVQSDVGLKKVRTTSQTLLARSGHRRHLTLDSCSSTRLGYIPCSAHVRGSPSRRVHSAHVHILWVSSDWLPLLREER